MAVHVLLASHNSITISPNTLFNIFVYWFLETLKKKSATKSRGHIFYVCVLVAQLCLTLYDPTNCSLQGFSVHGIFPARILEWLAIPFSRGSSSLRDRTLVSCITGRFFAV